MIEPAILLDTRSFTVTRGEESVGMVPDSHEICEGSSIICFEIGWSFPSSWSLLPPLFKAEGDGDALELLIASTLSTDS
jgi:hypothetical protein